MKELNLNKTHSNSSTVIPLFAVPIGLYTLNISQKEQNQIENKIQNLNYGPTNQSGGSNISKDLFLFKDKTFKLLKEKILKMVCVYNEEVMGYKKTNFKVTTSWATRCQKNEESERHKHCNSMYSAVYYNKCDEDISDISFYNNNWTSNNYDLETTEFNTFNSSSWSFKPKDKLLIIFPSSMYHKISKSYGEINRYSIACNFVPKPPYGYMDSFVNEK
jgi:uncharacterized protein (TIGR02466 family)|tara:strand:+ start:17783 stop:18436 length:654 start_codon:yes stop_codon:yes gene_type:complete